MPQDGTHEAVIRFFRVTKRYGSKLALSEVSLSIARGAFVFVSGPSGAGKSTLLKLLYLAEQPSQGQILVDGMNLTRSGRGRIPHLRRRMGIIFQDYKLIASRTVFANVALVLEAAGANRRLIPKRVAAALRLVEMDKRATAYPPSLSGGEQQRVAVARAMVNRPEFILADEPTGSLDDAAAAVIMDHLGRAHRQGTTVIVATHDQALIRRTGGHVVRLEDGRLTSETHTTASEDETAVFHTCP